MKVKKTSVTNMQMNITIVNEKLQSIKFCTFEKHHQLFSILLTVTRGLALVQIIIIIAAHHKLLNLPVVI